ncbi:MAG: hypothetical protein KJZ64_06850 [Sphingomonadaceae bacterium]|nr:hypothetical protein [Sphingomonadaceae bacterium]
MRLWIGLAAMSAVFSASTLAAQDSASGSLQYDDAPAIAIAHAVAHEYLIPEELRGNPEGNHRLHIVLSEAMVPALAAASESAFLAEVEGNGLRGLYLEIELPDRRWSRLSIARPNGEIEGRSFGLGGSELALDELSIDGDIVSGHARTVVAQELPDWGDGATRYAFDIRFRAPISRAPVPTERLSGPDARSSPQAAAVIALAQLLASDDLSRVRAGLHPRQPFAAAMAASDPDAREALIDVREYIGSPEDLRASIEFVLVYGDRAVVVTRTEQGGGRFVVERENGAWVVAAQDQPYR